MANICSVDHVVYATEETEEAFAQLVSFYNMLKECDTKYAGDNDKSVLWHLVAALDGEQQANTVGCRSELCSIQFNAVDKHIKIEEATAWSPCEFAWSKVLAHFEYLGRAWVSSEPGERVFKKCDNEGFFNGRTFIVFSDIDDDWSIGAEFGTDEEWRTAISDVCQVVVPSNVDIETALKLAKPIVEAKGFEFSIYEYEDAS